MGGKTGRNPTDRGKIGVKRSRLTEAQGVPVGLVVDGANRHDMKLVRATVDSVAVPRPTPTPEHPQGLCLDKGYDFAAVRRTLDEFGFTAHIRSRGEEAQAIKREAGFKARRWVVERTHSWLNRFRYDLLRISTMKASTAICRLVLSFLSQFFQRRRHFSSQAKDRSTTHRFGSTTKVCSSLRFTTSTAAPNRLCTAAAKGFPV